MAIIVRWHQAAPTSPIFSVFPRKIVVSTVVLIMFVVYIANLGKMMSVSNGETYITDVKGNTEEKFRFVDLTRIEILSVK